ncbi:enoyl-CoA hydratase/isomerase family protein [Ktedonospora formicarum]|uniref:Enoyl-CoA hydratase/isomerase family protein n=1 Tax=Ktedonospora formicarum TaxID=2778364 RepID=A0A8J3I2U9_9CHLR|nr:enoyl-CoA hydratase/isomerase family protein [Ktedonospora formicarum]GHO43869.1 hypothetical protein KSX_20320 [Ktedonospora formicarum]
MSNVRTRVRNNILWIILDSPPHNALNVLLLNQLAASLQKAVLQAPKLVVLSSTGEDAFCSGFELPPDGPALQELHEAAHTVDVVFTKLHQHGIPSVALIKGCTYGPGCELASLCDTLIARNDASFRMPAENARLFPSASTQRLPALLGPQGFEDLMRHGDTIDATTALDRGLVHQVLPFAHFLQESEELLVMLSIVGLTS